MGVRLRKHPDGPFWARLTPKDGRRELRHLFAQEAHARRFYSYCMLISEPLGGLRPPRDTTRKCVKCAEAEERLLKRLLE